MLVRPRNAGLLSRGIPGRDAEIVGRAEWPAIVPEEEWRALYTLLGDPSRRKQNGNETRWLGSGIYRCSKCGATMRAAPYGGTARTASRTPKHLYRRGEAAHLTVTVECTDEYVRGVVADRLGELGTGGHRRPTREVAATPTASAIICAADPGDTFLAAPIDVQRAVLATVLRVEVLPAPRRGGAWTPDRLNLTPVSAAE